MTSRGRGLRDAFEDSAGRSRLEYARARILELSRLNTFISMTNDEDSGPTVAVKDMIDVRGFATTGGGTLLPQIPAERAAPVVGRIRNKHGVVVGKTDLHEWAYGPTSENPHYRNVLNPHHERRVAGGSSGGSAVAVATGMCNWALGTDNGGSVRIPAALCGVVGLKPTRGAIPTEGVSPLSPSLDTVGILAASVAHATEASDIVSGQPKGATSAVKSWEEYRLAAPNEWVDGLESPVGAAWRLVARDMRRIPFPDLDQISIPFRVILRAEAFSVHRKWLNHHRGHYGRDVLTLLYEGGAITKDDYGSALRQLQGWTDAAEAAMDGIDALLILATPCIAPLIGDIAKRALLPRFTRPFNVTGHPVIGVPAPQADLSVGLQVVGHLGEDLVLCRVAQALQSYCAILEVE